MIPNAGRDLLDYSIERAPAEHVHKLPLSYPLTCTKKKVHTVPLPPMLCKLEGIYYCILYEGEGDFERPRFEYYYYDYLSIAFQIAVINTVSIGCNVEQSIFSTFESFTGRRSTFNDGPRDRPSKSSCRLHV